MVTSPGFKIVLAQFKHNRLHSVIFRKIINFNKECSRAYNIVIYVILKHPLMNILNSIKIHSLFKCYVPISISPPDANLTCPPVVKGPQPAKCKMSEI